MFSMTSLQSQTSPLRILEPFYQPKNRPHSKSQIKTFHDDNKLMKRPQIQQLYAPTMTLNKTRQLSTKKYLDTLSRNRSLQRRPLNRDEFYSFIKFSPKNSNNMYSHSHLSINPTQQPSIIHQYNPQTQSIDASSIMGKSNTIQTSRTQSLCSFLDKKQKYSLKNQLEKFQKQLKKKQQQDKDKLRFTFYNCEEKSKSIMEKFRSDQSLEERKTNMFQNTFRRTIVKQSLMQLLDKIDKKRRKGDMV